MVFRDVDHDALCIWTAIKVVFDEETRAMYDIGWGNNFAFTGALTQTV
jgi:hypothetical protein